MAETVKQFVDSAYQLISANSPTVSLSGDDNSKAINILNDLLQAYSSSSLLLPISKNIPFEVGIGKSEVTFGAADYIPTPDVTEGRLSNLQDVWLTLQHVTYPLIIFSRDVFLSSYKYDTQEGLPLYCIVYNETNLTRLRLYPGPSQVYTLNVYGKFELPVYAQNDTISNLPFYLKRFLKFALARDLAFYKGRANAWDEKLQGLYIEAKLDMESASTVNLSITSDNDSALNGAWRVRAGV